MKNSVQRGQTLSTSYDVIVPGYNDVVKRIVEDVDVIHVPV